MTGSPSSRPGQPLTFVVYTDRAPSASLAAALIGRGHSVMERGFSAAMHELLHVLRPELVVAYLDPADDDDLGALQSLKAAARDALVVLVSTSADESGAVSALDLGADCYVSGDVSADVVAAQGDALLRRFRESGAPAESPVVHLRDLTVDFDRRRVTRGSEALDLTRTEFDILGMLARNPGRVVSASEILAAIGQYAHTEAQARVIVKVHISHLRQKLEAGTAERYVETIRGVGYLLERRETKDDQNNWDHAPTARSNTA